MHDLGDNLGGPFADINRYRMFIRRRLLQGRELAVEQRHRHEVLVSRCHTPTDKIVRPLEVDQGYIPAIADDDVAVRTLQRRASQHAGFATRAPTVDFLGDFLQPRQPVCIRKRRAAVHFLYVRGWVKIIALLELAAERRCQQRRNRGCAGSGNAHDDGDYRLGYGVREGCGPNGLRSAIALHHMLLLGGAPASAGRAVRRPFCHDCRALVGGKTNFLTALANPSFSLLSVTTFACAFTSSLELPIAMEKPLLRNMRTSLGMSPMVAICADGMFRSLDSVLTTVPLLASGWVTSR